MIIAALAAEFAIFLNYKINSRKELLTSEPNITATPLSADTTKTTLLSRAQINFPPIRSAALVSLDSFPKDLGFLFFHSPEKIRVEKLIYENNQTGYGIIYNVTDYSLKAVYDQYSFTFRNNPEYKLVGEIRAANNLFGFNEWESQTYSLRVNNTYIEDSKNVEVNIQLLLK